MCTPCFHAIAAMHILKNNVVCISKIHVRLRDFEKKTAIKHFSYHPSPTHVPYLSSLCLHYLLHPYHSPLHLPFHLSFPTPQSNKLVNPIPVHAIPNCHPSFLMPPHPDVICPNELLWFELGHIPPSPSDLPSEPNNIFRVASSPHPRIALLLTFCISWPKEARGTGNSIKATLVDCGSLRLLFKRRHHRPSEEKKHRRFHFPQEASFS